MKTSSVIASLLFGSFAVAAPFDRRALVYKYETVVETVVVYTTVYGDLPTSAPASSATPTPSATAATTTSGAGEFYQQPKPASSPPVEAVSSAPAPPAFTPPAFTPPVETPTSTSTPTPTPTPAPAPAPETPVAPAPAPASSSVEAPAPPAYTPPAYTPSPAPTPSPVPAPAPAPAPAPPVSSEAPAPAYSAPSQATSYATGMTAGSSFSDVDITVYDNTGAAGACGEALHDDDIVVAIAQGAWNKMGGSTYNTQTGAATNPWCGKKVEVQYNGGSVVATIMDLCPGCMGMYDVDLSRGAWKALGIDETTRLKASWTLL